MNHSVSLLFVSIYIILRLSALFWLAYHSARQRGKFVCAYSVNFSLMWRLMEETAVCACLGFSPKERLGRDAEKYVGKQQWIEYLKQPCLRQIFLSFIPMWLRWKRQSIKIVVWWQTTPSLVLWLYYNNNNNNNNDNNNNFIFVQHFHKVVLHLQNTTA